MKQDFFFNSIHCHWDTFKWNLNMQILKIQKDSTITCNAPCHGFKNVSMCRDKNTSIICHLIFTWKIYLQLRQILTYADRLETRTHTCGETSNKKQRERLLKWCMTSRKRVNVQWNFKNKHLFWSDTPFYHFIQPS